METQPSNYPLTIEQVIEKSYPGKDGYLFFYDPAHPLANRNGAVVSARHIASAILGRWLTKDDVVYYRDRDKKNLRPENLELITKSDLGRKRSKQVAVCCEFCSKPIYTNQARAHRRHTCSRQEQAARREKADWPADEALAELVWQKPVMAIAAELNVSPNAVVKRCKVRGIDAPGRGDWARMRRWQKVHPVASLSRPVWERMFQEQPEAG